jgi:tyrosinase
MHGAVTFPTWHRPYLALFEVSPSFATQAYLTFVQQVLWTKAQAIAQTYQAERRSIYEAAALTLRLPYWDWGMKQELPIAVQSSSVVINTANGIQLVENPLYDYNFQGNAEANGFPRDRVSVADYPYTVRQPNFDTRQSNETAVNAQLYANAGHIMSSTYSLFTELTNYSAFSCIAPNGEHVIGNSIELIHGNIHNIVGGSGHMTWPEVSAFDPIFWLHHANVDRLFAMWQVLNPNSYFTSAEVVNESGSFYEPPGSFDSANSTLAPFHPSNGSRMFTNEDVRSISRFNYGYPDIPDWFINGTQLVNFVRAQVNTKYNPPAQQQAQDAALDHPISLLAAFSNIGPQEFRAFGVNNADMQWKIKVAVNRYAYKSAYSLHFFMGEPPDDIRDWPTAPNLVGTQSQFVGSNVSALYAAGSRNVPTRGEVSITHTLLAGVRRGLLNSLAPEFVIPLLRIALIWRARTADGCEVDLTQLDGLSVSVGSRRTIPSTNRFDFPTYDPIIWHPDATAGKVGGAGAWQIGRLIGSDLQPDQL